MAKPTREDAIAALWTLLQGLVLPNGLAWGERSRGIKQFDQVAAGSQPALFMQQGPQRASRRREQGITTWEWTAVALVYFRCDTLRNDDDWKFANTLLDSIEALLQGKPPGSRQTLGGVVYDCYIDGEVGLYESIDDANQAVITVPITILTGI